MLDRKVSMKLTNKQKALVGTVGLFVGSAVIAYIVQFILLNVSAEALGYVFGAGLLFFFASMIYQIMLSRFEYQDTLTKMVDKK